MVNRNLSLIISIRIGWYINYYKKKPTKNFEGISRPPVRELSPPTLEKSHWRDYYTGDVRTNSVEHGDRCCVPPLPCLAATRRRGRNLVSPGARMRPAGCFIVRHSAVVWCVTFCTCGRRCTVRGIYMYIIFFVPLRFAVRSKSAARVRPYVCVLCACVVQCASRCYYKTFACVRSRVFYFCFAVCVCECCAKNSVCESARKSAAMMYRW